MLSLQLQASLVKQPLQHPCCSCSKQLPAARGAQRCRRAARPASSRAVAPKAALRAVESFDATFELSAEADRDLRAMLSSETFCQQVVQQTQQPEGVQLGFTGMLFQPVPWSMTTKKGMPPQFEQFLEQKDKYAIINVPPNFMFKAKVFKPSRLCAIYQRR